MPTNKVSIVPVHLESIRVKSPTDCAPLKPVCIIQADQFKVSLYQGIKNHVIPRLLIN